MHSQLWNFKINQLEETIYGQTLLPRVEHRTEAEGIPPCNLLFGPGKCHFHRPAGGRPPSIHQAAASD